MFKLSGIIAACAVALTVGAANADTFDWSFSLLDGAPFFGVGSGGGTLVATPDGPGQYIVTSITGGETIGCAGGPGTCAIGAVDPPGDFLSSDNIIFHPGTQALDSAGLSLVTANFTPTDDVFGNFSYNSATGLYLYTEYGAAHGTHTADALFSVTPTPLPGALPLFATGVAALGLLSRRRKRKAALAA